MSGFFRVAFEGEYFNQAIVNVFHFRSAEWLPFQGNPFDDTLAALDAVLTELENTYLAIFGSDYKLAQATATGYDDAYTIVTPSPMVRSANVNGSNGLRPGMGAAQCAILGLRLGAQVQINSIGSSKRNRGYLALGPLGEGEVDNYTHLSDGSDTRISAFAQHVDNTILVLAPAVTLIPIRIHEKWTMLLGNRVLLWRTYSDVLGYSLNRVASYRRSRRPEA